MINRGRKNTQFSAFTIVELLVVIVVIGILAAITIISYSGISNKAIVANLQGNLDANSRLLKLYNVEYGYYPSYLDSNYCPSAPTADSRYCLKTISGVDLTYSGGGQAFVLTDKHASSGLFYQVTESSTPSQVASLTCPTGFIVVPGSATYGTSDFCVMKYEAKADDNGDGIGDTNQNSGYNSWPANTYPISASRKIVSSAAGYPISNISQDTAISVSSTSGYVYGCSTGCHLITDAEWMTIAQNIASVVSNWSGGSVGSGYIYSGHNDAGPTLSLVADSNDSNGYLGTGQSSPSNQRRTLTLSNGEVIWDFAGDVWEWTTGQNPGGGQPAGMSSWAYYQWNAISGGTFAVSPYPSSTGISGASSWTSSNGIGKLWGNSSDVTLHGLIRGGSWDSNVGAGIFGMTLDNVPTNTYRSLGFRVAR